MLVAVAGEDSKFCAQLEKLLAAQQHKVAVFPWSRGLLGSLTEGPPDLVVIAPPPSRDGVTTLLGALRAEAAFASVPVLCVAPRAGISDGVAFLDAGADDFINRPFNSQIFLARVRTLLRRRIWSGAAAEEGPTVLGGGGLVLKLLSRQAQVCGKPVSLTRLEFELLAFMMKQPEQVFSRQKLLESVWNYPDSVETRTLDKHIETLRRKLGAHGSAIQTVHGVGYSFRDTQIPQSRS